MAGGRPDPEQTSLLLHRAQRFYVLAAIDHRRTGLKHDQWTRLRTLIEQIELFDTVAYIETLAAKCRCSRSTLLRVARLGRRAGVLRWTQQRDESGRQGPSLWEVRWDLLSVWAGPLPAGDPECHQSVKNVTPCDTLAPVLTPGDYLLGLDNNNPPPPSPEPSATGNAPEGWRRLEEVLLELGVDRAPAAVRTVREQGCTLEHAYQLVAHWRDHEGGTVHAAWTPAGLCWRLQNARPHLPPDRGWPKPSEAYERHRQQLADERMREQRLVEQRRNRKEQQERDRRFAEEHPDYDPHAHIQEVLAALRTGN